MYAAIRQGKAKTGMAEELTRRIKEGAIPIISDVEGFMGYYVVYASDDTVTAIMVPAGFNGADVIDRAYRRYNLALGAGLSQVAGKLFRIGHLGDLNELMLLGAIAGAEMAMRDVGIEVELGSGVGAAEVAFRDAATATETRIAAE